MSISRRSVLTKIPIALASTNVLKAVGVFEKVESIPHATHFAPLSQRFKMEWLKILSPKRAIITLP